MEDNVVVAVLRNAGWRWFRSEEDIWVLDQAAWARAFQEAGYEHTPDYSSRFGIPTVDETTVDDFLERASQYRMNSVALRDELIAALETATSWFDVVHCVPRLLVDFDRRRLLSLCGESEVLEKFVPPGWNSRYEDFYKEIPREERYWEIDGKSLLAPLYKAKSDDLPRSAILSAALQEYSAHGRVEHAKCDVCGSTIEVETSGSEGDLTC